MTHRFELLSHVAAYALGIALGRSQLGVLFFESYEFLQEPVKLGIRHLRRIERVILVSST